MFKDEAKIVIESGNGGNGARSFRKEKYVPYGGPDGGDGGRGGDIILRVNRHLKALGHIRNHSFFKAKNGGNGSRSRRHGKDGDCCYIDLPLGTVVRDVGSGKLLLDVEGGECLAKGGMGGRGNWHFRSSKNQAPQKCESGELGQRRELIFELKLIADIGLVGYPNVGKSTLLSRLSRARPKIGDYLFTTLHPNLGIMEFSLYESYIIADIPGLIEGAHLGLGLGLQFLRHIERTKVLIYVLDITNVGVYEQFKILREEIRRYDEGILKKRYSVVLNKIDCLSEEEQIERREQVEKMDVVEKKLFHMVSAKDGVGIEGLKQGIQDLMMG